MIATIDANRQVKAKDREIRRLNHHLEEFAMHSEYISCENSQNEARFLTGPCEEGIVEPMSKVVQIPCNGQVHVVRLARGHLASPLGSTNRGQVFAVAYRPHLQHLYQ